MGNIIWIGIFSASTVALVLPLAIISAVRERRWLLVVCSIALSLSPFFVGMYSMESIAAYRGFVIEP